MIGKKIKVINKAIKKHSNKHVYGNATFKHIAGIIHQLSSHGFKKGDILFTDGLYVAPVLCTDKTYYFVENGIIFRDNGEEIFEVVRVSRCYVWVSPIFKPQIIIRRKIILGDGEPPSIIDRMRNPLAPLKLRYQYWNETIISKDHPMLRFAPKYDQKIQWLEERGITIQD